MPPIIKQIITLLLLLCASIPAIGANIHKNSPETDARQCDFHKIDINNLIAYEKQNNLGTQLTRNAINSMRLCDLEKQLEITYARSVSLYKYVSKNNGCELLSHDIDEYIVWPYVSTLDVFLNKNGCNLTYSHRFFANNSVFEKNSATFNSIALRQINALEQIITENPISSFAWSTWAYLNACTNRPNITIKSFLNKITIPPVSTKEHLNFLAECGILKTAKNVCAWDFIHASCEQIIDNEIQTLLGRSTAVNGDSLSKYNTESVCIYLEACYNLNKITEFEKYVSIIASSAASSDLIQRILKIDNTKLSAKILLSAKTTTSENKLPENLHGTTLIAMSQASVYKIDGLFDAKNLNDDPISLKWRSFLGWFNDQPRWAIINQLGDIICAGRELPPPQTLVTDYLKPSGIKSLGEKLFEYNKHNKHVKSAKIEIIINHIRTYGRAKSSKNGDKFIIGLIDSCSAWDFVNAKLSNKFIHGLALCNRSVLKEEFQQSAHRLKTEISDLLYNYPQNKAAWYFALRLDMLYESNYFVDLIKSHDLPQNTTEWIIDDNNIVNYMSLCTETIQEKIHLKSILESLLKFAKSINRENLQLVHINKKLKELELDITKHRM